MKKLLLMLVVVAMFSSVTAIASLSPVKKMTAPKHEWAKSATGTWLGQDKTWFQLKTTTIWSSKDGKQWEQVKDGRWQDKAGNWLMINNKTLVASADGGKTWNEVPEWKWEGTDGTWNKFDKDWTLWVMTHDHH